MGRFDPLAPGWEDRLKTWRDQPYMLGIRMTFRVAPFSGWLEDHTLDDFWAACERLGIPVMVLVPGIVRMIAPVAERYPNLKLIIDHWASTSRSRAKRRRTSTTCWRLPSTRTLR